MASALPFLDLASPDFSTRSIEVLSAREQNWCAQTPFGLAVLRYKQAGQLLRDKRLRQGSHNWPNLMGLEGSFAEFWQRSIISTHGDKHKTLRLTAVPALAPDFIQGLLPKFESSAKILTEQVTPDQPCDFMVEFSNIYAGHAICILLGLSTSEWKEISSNASYLGLAMGITAKQYEARFNRATDWLMRRADDLLAEARNNPSDINYISRLLASAEKQNLSDEQTLKDLIIISIFGGVDTTRAQLGLVMSLFADYPSEWGKLRDNPDLAENAVDESLRSAPTTTWATRQALESFDYEGINIEKNQILHILVHASSRDPVIGHADSFDISAERKLHFGFGGGAHHCLGHLVARNDIAIALKTLSKKFSSVEWAGNAKWLPDTGNTGPVTLPLRFGV